MSKEFCECCENECNSKRPFRLYILRDKLTDSYCGTALLHEDCIDDYEEHSDCFVVDED